MGYTHYWTNFTELPPLYDTTKCRIQVVLARYDDILIGPDAGRPLVTTGRVAFNGKGDDGCEDFDWDRYETWDFCKTARKSYDIVVGMVLMILKKQYGTAMSVTSDGECEDWRPILTGLDTLLQGSCRMVVTYEWITQPSGDGTDPRENIDEQLRRLRLGMDRKMLRPSHNDIIGR